MVIFEQNMARMQTRSVFRGGEATWPKAIQGGWIERELNRRSRLIVADR